MNIQRIPEYLLRWGATLGGIGLALYLAKSLGDGNGGRVALILFGIAAMMLVFAARERVWLLIPITWGLAGQIPSLDVPFALRDLVVMFVFAAFLILKAFKVVLRQPVTLLPDILCYLMLLYLVASFTRNPVGVEALNSDRVGGRPYFNVFIGALTYWVLSRSSLSLKRGNLLAILTTCGRIAEGVAAVFLSIFPSLAFLFAAFYASPFFGLVEGIDTSGPIADPGSESTKRLGYLVVIGQPLLTYLAARYPMGAFFNPARPWRMILLCLGTLCVLLSGFRSALAISAGVFIVAGYLRSGWREVWKMASIIALLFGFVALGNGTLFELPRSAQRALSWLPGKWDEYAVLEAKESTRWRTDMWVQMLTTNRYIDSHTFGDGFGFSKRDYEQMLYFKKYGDSAAGQESFMISGAVHSGPVSAIRFVGYVGLALHLLILFALAIEAWKILRRAYPTPFRLLTFLVCIPFVLEPFVFIVIFGTFESSFPDALFSLGMLRMLGNSLDDHQIEESPGLQLSREFKVDQPIRKRSPALVETASNESQYSLSSKAPTTSPPEPDISGNGMRETNYKF